ncbi:unnamed protein product [Ectocarpus sp. 12 AP-2014]
MLENPHVSVLGSSVATFSGDSVRVGGERKRQQQPGTDDTLARRHLPAAGVQRIARHPTDRALLAWSLLFGCCVAHPSVMLRRDRVMEAGGYDPATEPAEDYDLWLRLEALAPGCVANLGEAAAIRRPECAASPGNLAEAARLLGDLGEAATVAVTGAGDAIGTDGVVVPSQVRDRGPDEDGSHNGRGRGHDGDDGADGDERRWQQRVEELMIASDVEARLGAMAVHAMSRFGEGAAPVLDEWKRRFPDRPLLFVLGGRGRGR